MKKLFAVCVLSLITAASALADSPVAMSEGELRRIDQAGQRVTLRHGPIDNLKMPPMTMVFRLAEGVDLEGLAAGDQVRFRAESEGGSYVVTVLEKAE